jgi:iron complex outermembrane recepter protein
MKKLLLTVLLSTSAIAEPTLDPVVVTATRYELSNLEIPASVEKINMGTGLNFTPTESLNRISGLSVQDSFMTDIRLSSRGFGARSPFASRGIKIYRDGIPVASADGFGATSVIDMNTIGSIEVLKGPMSSMYGSSASGVAQFFTEIPTVKSEVSGGTMYGDFNTKQNNVKYSGYTNQYKYLINQSQFESDGYRDYSRFNRDQSTAKMWYDISTDTTLELGFNAYKQTGQDYGNANSGITLARFRSNPYSVDPSVLNIGSWKTVEQTDANIKLNHIIDSRNFVTLAVYGGTRSQEQLSPTTESATLLTTTSGLLKTDRAFGGAEFRHDYNSEIAGKKYTITTGISYSQQNDTVSNERWMRNGVRQAAGVYTRNADQIATSFDQFVQGRLTATPRLDIHAGIRRVTTSLEFRDRLTSIADGGDNSGSINYNNVIPAAGLVYKLTNDTSAFASLSQGLETPTFTETQFNSTAATATPNTTIKPSQSTNYEVGIKSYALPNTYIGTSLYHITTRDEIITSASAPGIRVFNNRGTTTRDGIEVNLKSDLPLGFGVYAAASYLNAVFDTTGLAIPNVPRTTGFLELSWTYKPKNFKVAVETVHSGRVFGETDNSVGDDGYTIYNFRASLKQNYNKLTITEYIAVNNIADTVYVASLRTAASFGRYYETGFARNTVIGINAKYAF